MRILGSPKVYLIARPQIVEDGLNQFLKDQKLHWPTPTEGVSDAERLVEVAGRCCYMSFGKKAGSKTNERYLQNLLGINEDGSWKPGPAHGSVCEHPCWSFLVVGAGRGFSHEQVRHRTGWAYSQISTRYCDFEREEETGTWEPGFCIPPLAQLSQTASDLFADKLQKSQQAYCELLNSIEHDLSNNEAYMKTLAKFEEKDRKRMLRKAARGAARDILPIATEAIMVMSANARAIWNCIVLRANEHAEAVIRDVYVQIARLMEQEMPSLFKGIKYEQCWDGSTVAMMPRDKL